MEDSQLGSVRYQLDLKLPTWDIPIEVGDCDSPLFEAKQICDIDRTRTTWTLENLATCILFSFMRNHLGSPDFIVYQQHSFLTTSN